LVVPQPPAWTCHRSNFDANECQKIKENMDRRLLVCRTSGSPSNFKLADFAYRNLELPSERYFHKPCSKAIFQCMLSMLFSSVSDVQMAVFYAAKHNLHLVVMGSGRDYIVGAPSFNFIPGEVIQARR
jgi:hypothetical protein